MAAKIEPVICNVCEKEIPRSAAMVPESKDIILHFCGIGCFEQWKKDHRRQDADDIRRAVDDGMQDLRIRKQ